MSIDYVIIPGRIDEILEYYPLVRREGISHRHQRASKRSPAWRESCKSSGSLNSSTTEAGGGDSTGGGDSGSGGDGDDGGDGDGDDDPNYIILVILVCACSPARCVDQAHQQHTSRLDNNPRETFWVIIQQIVVAVSSAILIAALLAKLGLG